MSLTRTLAAIAVLTLFCSVLAQVVLPRDVRQLILQAVVEVRPYDSAANRFDGGAGSGTIISPDGFVLTNFHVVGDLDSGQAFEWHGIFITDPTAPDQPPQLTYWARYIAGDAAHDLAIVRIVELRDESPLPPGTTFVAMPVGDSNALIPGDPLTVVGYPGISGTTITFTTGIVSGFLGEDLQTGGKQWIKTDAKLARGNSGGAAFDEHGVLVGVPTLRFQTSDQGYIETQDYLRPVALAWPLISAHVSNVARVGGVGDQVAGQLPPAVTPQPTPAPTTPAPATPTPDPVPVGVLHSERGELSSSDFTLDSGEYVDVVWHHLEAGVPVTVSLSSSSFDVYLVVLDPSDTLVLEVDDSAGQGLDVLETFVPQVSGEYTFGITSAFPGETGDYLFELRPSTSVALGPGDSGFTGITTSPPAEGSSSGFVGPLPLGQRFQNELAGSSERTTYHTYAIEVPPGAMRLTIALNGEANLGLFLKHDTEVTNWGDEGDWDHRQLSASNRAVLTVDQPAAGTWYLDVTLRLGNSSTVGYALQVR